MHDWSEGIHDMKTGRRALLSASALAAMAIGAPSAALAASREGKGGRSETAVPLVPVPQPPPLTEGYAQVPGGGRIWYWDTGGKGEAVILLHPATGSAMSWPYQQAAFAKAGSRVIGYSRGGFFRSDPAAGTPPPREIDALLDTLGIARAHLVGSAAGAMVALDYALEKPGRVISLTLASSAMAPDHPDIAEAWKILLPEGFSSLPPEFRELGPSYRAANPAGTEAWKEIQRNSRPPRPEGARPAARTGNGMAPPASNRSRSVFEALAATRIPLLLLTGDCDLYMPPALLEKVAALLPKARTAIIENAGHAAFWEQPDAFNRILLSFLKNR